MKIKKVTFNSPDYPEQLQEIPSPPKVLYFKGELNSISQMPRLAVVGSRKVTPYGKSITGQLVRECASKGITIISGLALGVDSLAHHAALEAGAKTIAVLPCGLDKIYPAQHHQLAARILEQGGALISEYEEGMPPLLQNFVARNRIVSGLADAVLITEAAERSGTLHTAQFALDQGRTVMAVPGNITSPYSRGTNNLIKAGALPVTSSEDILNILNVSVKVSDKVDILGGTEEETILLKLLASGISGSAELLSSSQLAPQIFNQSLTMLEINGRIRPLGAGHWAMN